MKNTSKVLMRMSQNYKEFIEEPIKDTTKFNMNKLIINSLTKACEAIKPELLKYKDIENFEKIRESFREVYKGRVSVSESYENLEAEGVITRFDFSFEEAYYDIASELCIPRNGATNLLIDAYKADPSNQKESFREYQDHNIEEAYHFIEEKLAGANDTIDYN